jgi:hypothetical protein
MKKEIFVTSEKGFVFIENGVIPSFEIKLIAEKDMQTDALSVADALLYGFIGTNTTHVYKLNGLDIEMLKHGANVLIIRDINQEILREKRNADEAAFNLAISENEITLKDILHRAELNQHGNLRFKSADYDSMVEIFGDVESIRYNDFNNEFSICTINDEFVNRLIKIKKTLIAKNTVQSYGIADILALCSIEDNKLILPSRDVAAIGAQEFMSFQKAIEINLGSYQKGAYIFPFSPKEIIANLANNEKLNTIKELQYFPTQNLDVLHELIKGLNLDNCSILEPSAGLGHIADYLSSNFEDIDIQCVEFYRDFAQILKDKGYNVECSDFLSYAKNAGKKGFFFDYVIANPPFTNNQDIKHVMSMYKLAKKGVRSVMSTIWLNGSDRAAKDFRLWLESVSGTFELLPKGVFKDSGTNIETCIVSMDK